MREDPESFLRELREISKKPSTVAEVDQLQMQVRRNAAILLASYTEVDVQHAEGNSLEAFNVLLASVAHVAQIDTRQKDQLIAHLALLLYAELRHKHGGSEVLKKILDGDIDPENFVPMFAPEPDWPDLDDLA